jgi:Ca2+-binding EF-hand superfamily protein
MAAFKLLDEEETGVIELDLMTTYITEMGIPFLPHEAKAFEKFIMGSDKGK